MNFTPTYVRTTQLQFSILWLQFTHCMPASKENNYYYLISRFPGPIYDMRSEYCCKIRLSLLGS